MKTWIVVAVLVIGIVVLVVPTLQAYEPWEQVFQCMSECNGANDDELLECYAACRMRYDTSNYTYYAPIVMAHD